MVNRRVQMTLIRRCAVYWLACVLFLVLPLTLWRCWHDPATLILRHFAQVCVDYAAVLATSALLLPLAAYDMLKLSNRIAGPLHRLHGSLADLAVGDTVSEVRFRPDDFWPEMAEEFNRVVDRLNSQTGCDRPVNAESHNEGPKVGSVVGAVRSE